MNAVYKLIFNVSTGTWAVAHEFAAARGKKSRTRLAAALAVALTLPAGAALAADSPEAQQCGIGQSVSADGLRCEAAVQPTSGSIGVAATAGQNDRYIAWGAADATRAAATATGNPDNIAMGIGAEADARGPELSASGAVALGSRAKAIGTGTLALGTESNAAGAGTMALGLRSSATASGSVAIGLDSVADVANTVSVGNATTQRKIVNMAGGALSASSTEAVNGSQLYATNQRMDTKVDNDYVKVGEGQDPANAADNTGRAGNIAIGSNARSTTNSANSASIALGENALSNAAGSVALGTDSSATGTGSVSIGLRSSATASGSVALGLDSTADEANSVSVGNASVKRRIVNMAAGTADTDAVNVSQLQPIVAGLGGGAAIDPSTGVVTGPTYRIGGTDYNNVGGALGNLDGRVTDLEGSGAGSGLVEHDATTGEITVANGVVGGDVNMRDANGDTRTLTGIKAGTARTDAVNFGQLTDTATSVATALGGGSSVDAAGKITAPTYSIGDESLDNVGDAFAAVDTSLTNLDGRVTGNTTNISNLTDQFNELTAGTAGIVTYDGTTGTVNVATTQGGNIVNVAGTAGARKVAGVADGEVAGDSDEAVNGSQLSATNDRVTANETSITDLDGRVTGNTTNISNLTSAVDDLSNGEAGLVTIDGTTGNVNVAAGKGGDAVSFEGTAGARRLGGVANGVADDEVATIAQLRASGLVDPNDGRALGAVVYDDMDLARATLGGTHGTVLGNVGNGLIGAGSMEAINGGQLFDMKALLQGKIDGLDGRVGTIEQGIADGSIGGPGSGGGSGGGAGDGDGMVAPGEGAGSVVIGDGAAGGAGSIGIGGGSAAGGDGSVAIGEGAAAPGKDSVAIGSGSTTDRDREVSVGAPGAERVIGNVAAGTRPTDAVNLKQMDDRFAAERDWSNSRFQAVDKRIDRMGAISAAYAGMAMNTAGLNGENRIGAGIGQQNGRSALAVGYQRVMGVKQNVSVSLGGAFSGSDKSMSAGAGFSW